MGAGRAASQQEQVARIHPTAIAANHGFIARAAEQIAADIRQGGGVDAEQIEHGRREIDLADWYVNPLRAAAGHVNHERHAISQGPVQQVVAKPERMREFGGPREAGTVVAGHHHHRSLQLAVVLECREKLAERLIEIVHAVNVVAKGRVTKFAHIQFLVAVGEGLEGIVQRLGDQPRRKR